MSAGCANDILVAASELDERLLDRLADCRATLVRTFEEAQRALREHWFGLVVIDLNFDDVRMFDLLQHVRSLAHCQGVPVLCVQLAEAGAGMGAALDRLVKRLGGNGFVDLRARAPLALSRLCLLIIDHDVDAAHRLAEVLEQAGHEVDFAYDGRAGLDAARRLRPDAVFVDLRLPGFDCAQLARQLRGERALGSTLIVGLGSEAMDEEARKRMRQAGFDHLAERSDPSSLLTFLSGVHSAPPRYMLG